MIILRWAPSVCTGLISWCTWTIGLAMGCLRPSRPIECRDSLHRVRRVGDFADASASCETSLTPTGLRFRRAHSKRKGIYFALAQTREPTTYHIEARETASSALAHQDLTIDGQVTARLSVSKPGYHH